MVEHPLRAVIVSRHKSTQEFLSKILEKHGIPYDIVEHVDNPRILEGYYLVLGNIPLTLLLKTSVKYYIQVSLEIPKELRGKELGIEELVKYARFILFQHVITFTEWYPREAFEKVVEYDIFLVKDIDATLNEIKRRFRLEVGA